MNEEKILVTKKPKVPKEPKSKKVKEIPESSYFRENEFTEFYGADPELISWKNWVNCCNIIRGTDLFKKLYKNEFFEWGALENTAHIYPVWAKEPEPILNFDGVQVDTKPGVYDENLTMVLPPKFFFPTYRRYLLSQPGLDHILNNVDVKPFQKYDFVTKAPPRPEQQECVDLAEDELKNKKYFKGIIQAPPGWGKAVYNEILLETPCGNIKMGDIREGDMVFGRDGKPTKVLRVYPQGKVKLYKFTFELDEKIKFWIAFIYPTRDFIRFILWYCQYCQSKSHLLKVDFKLEDILLFNFNNIFLHYKFDDMEKIEFLMQNMIKMSRLETGILQIHKEDQNLYETIRHAVADVVPEAALKGINLYVNCEENMMIRHDSKWTEEVIYNILDNALKYTESGGKIRIQAERQELFFKISISDTGKGIAPERQAEIFTRFYREPEVHDKPGVGIGLYLARTIMELQKGYIEVQSEIGKGACFRLYFPVNEP